MQNSLTSEQVEALKLLSTRLGELKVSYVVIGGLAAIALGARRPLVDIDIQVSANDMSLVKFAFSDSVQTDIRHYVSKHWDIQQMVLMVNSIQVDVCGAEDFYVIIRHKRYRIDNTLPRALILDVGGIWLPIMPKEVLMHYKRLLQRPVDLQDLKDLSDE